MDVVPVWPLRGLEGETWVQIHGHLHDIVEGGVSWRGYADGRVFGDVGTHPQGVGDGHVAYFRVVSVAREGFC